jgi:enoyl-CoA hydratase
MTQDVLFEVKNHLGVIMLNRPKAYNALNRDMFTALYEKLIAWENDSSIKAVLVRSCTEKAFCAGGDLRSIYENQGRPLQPIRDYFKLEYETNKTIFHYKKPYIALTNSVTMGGGVGISVNASHCVAAENLRWAMPETNIGFFPDTGATYYLSRMPYFMGTYLALTGISIDVTDALHLKLVKHCIPFEKFDALENALIAAIFDEDDFATVTSVLNQFAYQPRNPNQFPIEKISACFCFETIEEIMMALESDNSAWAQEVLSLLLTRSPTSLKVALHQLQLAKTKSFSDIIAMDFHIACAMLDHADFYEGIRAAIIDKDKNPHWKPALISEVKQADVLRYF